jgi:hypothetical protein
VPHLSRRTLSKRSKQFIKQVKPPASQELSCLSKVGATPVTAPQADQKGKAGRSMSTFLTASFFGSLGSGLFYVGHEATGFEVINFQGGEL